jgi:Polyketide cyclase / dehydrase and lipid transport
VTALTLHASGTVAPEEAWERYAVPQRWSSWSPQITGVDTGAVRIAAGVTGRVRGPLGLAVPFEIDDVDESGRSWTWRVRVGPASVRLHHWVTGGPDAGSTTGLRIEGPLPIAFGYAPLARLALNRLVRQ